MKWNEKKTKEIGKKVGLLLTGFLVFFYLRLDNLKCFFQKFYDAGWPNAVAERKMASDVDVELIWFGFGGFRRNRLLAKSDQCINKFYRFTKCFFFLFLDR